MSAAAESVRSFSKMLSSKTSHASLFGSLKIACATSSEGSSSLTKRRPLSFTRIAPSTRTACGTTLPVTASVVQCMETHPIFVLTPPALRASTSPSPVAPAELVVESSGSVGFSERITSIEAA